MKKIISFAIYLLFTLNITLADIFEDPYNEYISGLNLPWNTDYNFNWWNELIIMAKLNSIILKIPIFKHQQFVLYFSLIPIIIKIISIFIEFEDGQKHFIYEYNLYWIPIGLLIYFPNGVITI